MKIFGTVQPFIESADSSFKIGRLVANYEFYNALFRYSDFDEFHIFCPTFSNCKLSSEKIVKENIPNDRKQKIKIFHISSLKQTIAENNYHIFHLGGWGFFYPGFAHFRNINSPKMFPITGVTHSLNAKESSFHALKVCMAPTMPFDSIVCTSNCGKKVLQNLFAQAENNFKHSGAKYNGRMDVIPLGIDDAYRKIPDRTESRKLLGIDNDSFVILMLGRLETNNKMDILPFLNCVKNFVQKNKDKKINLVIAGGGDNQSQKFIKDVLKENQLEAAAKLFINFEDGLKTHLYRAANVYTSPIDNFQETFGISVVEAMAHECTPVISDFNGYSEIVDHDINGVKIPTYWADATDGFRDISEIMNFPTHQLLLSQSVAVDIDKMSDAFQELLDNPEKCTALGKEARKKTQQKYFWSDIIKQYCNLWDELAKQAAESKIEISKPKNPWEVDYYSVFSHYPSKIVAADSKISLTEYGSKVFISGKVPVPYSDVSASIIVPQLVMAAIKNINQNIITAQQFAAALKKNAEISDSTAMYYLLWMAKYNLIKISE
ncbi:MAG: hypothetical protein A2Y10_04685 [Planctomycetes bacterium GWF2_41_51]|nr:MAG: hypothetical protein A2Y10_04685 [Planctomycetes bacterium GWF2_41_51]HBG26628.1 hypothetical protein [Phycisphaerales bacterium]